jgi:hypothetical protein
MTKMMGLNLIKYHDLEKKYQNYISKNTKTSFRGLNLMIL